ncbi:MULTISPECIES: hypothetical protein [Bacillus cereus group]|uniref:hypothetical protein n=1 Tax=Bacillus cereus group TaxID=86661 RepID=UPI0014838C2E|nr:MULTISPECIES: hypothetical protein [Bacillus cereus group]MED2864963.1 hypothetical protein [Bacillus thuringiensis]HDR7388556.1 hypothetical protein [Bacillus toyonensis]
MKEFQFGNTKVIIHSSLALMEKEEQKEWFQQEWEKKNPILRSIVEAAVSCQEEGGK